MAKRIDFLDYQISSHESIKFHIQENGTSLKVLGAIDSLTHQFVGGSRDWAILATDLDSSHPDHQCELIFVFDDGSTSSAKYTMTVLDGRGNVLEKPFDIVFSTVCLVKRQVLIRVTS